jgi:hypothetical protein
MKSRPDIFVLRRNVLRPEIPMGTLAIGMMIVLSLLIFCFLNLSREKWFNEASRQQQREDVFECFPKLIPATANGRKQNQTRG